MKFNLVQSTIKSTYLEAIFKCYSAVSFVTTWYVAKNLILKNNCLKLDLNV